MKILKFPYYKVVLYPDRFGGSHIQRCAHELEEAGFNLDRPISVHQDYMNADISFQQQEVTEIDKDLLEVALNYVKRESEDDT